jgi:hypothetical protein
MANIARVGLSALLVMVSGGLAHAEDISAKKILIKDNADTTKRQIQLQSGDAGVQFSEADDPGASGAAIHVYSTSDDFCVTLEPGQNWKNTGTKWKYKSTATKNMAQVGDGKLKVKIKSAVTYSLADDGTQGTVNAQVQFGTAGTRYCMRCSGNTKDDAGKFIGKNCVAAACDAESPCDPPGTTTTTTTTTSSTTTTACPPPTPPIIEGSLTATPGRFNYNLQLGLPGANAACHMNFPCSHACTYQELQAAEAAGELVGLMDTANNPVTSFWAIDSSQPILQQCNDDGPGGSHLNWEYGTAHTMSRGQKVTLDNATGVLGALQSSVQCNFAPNNWVGCCE